MADSTPTITDPVLGAARAVLESSYRFAAVFDETRRMLLKAHLRSVEDRLAAMRSAQHRIAGAADWASLQAAQAQTLNDQAELQATLARAYGKIFTDATSAWLDQCRECGNDWTQRMETANGAASGDGAGFFGPLSASLAEFYDQIGKMTPLGMVPPIEAPATARPRAH